MNEVPGMTSHADHVEVENTPATVGDAP
jgi:hypothetical protein